jgi:hypothetical protein
MKQMEQKKLVELATRQVLPAEPSFAVSAAEL